MRARNEETTYEVWLVTSATHAEAEAMRKFEEARPPSDRQPRGRVTLRLMGDVSATEYLAQRGIVVPPMTDEERQSYDISPSQA